MTWQALPIEARDGTVVAWTAVDAEDFPLAAPFSWRLTGAGYAQRRESGAVVLLHRQIMGLTAGDGLEVDHINRDPLDNRRSNLRVCTHAENRQNTPSTGRTSRHRGVSWDKHRGKWVAQSKSGVRQKFLGRFDAEEEAAAAARRWREENMTHAVEVSDAA